MKGYRRLLAVTAAATLLAACGTSRSVVVQPASGSHQVVRTWGRGSAVSSSKSRYRVVRGDTLYSIAFRHGLDFRELARWNGIPSPYRIWPGQELRLKAGPAGATPRREVTQAPRKSLPAVHPASRPVAPPVASVAIAVPHEPVGHSVGAAPVASPAISSAAPGGTRSLGGVAWRWPASGPLIKGFQAGDAIPGIEIGGRAGDPVRAAADGVVVYSGNGLVGYGELIIIKHSDSYLSAYGHNRKRLVKEGERVSAGQEIAEMGDTGAPRDELQFQIRQNGNPVNPMDYLPRR